MNSPSILYRIENGVLYFVTDSVRKHLRSGEILILKAERPDHIGARTLPSSLWLRVIASAFK